MKKPRVTVSSGSQTDDSTLRELELVFRVELPLDHLLSLAEADTNARRLK